MYNLNSIIMQAGWLSWLITQAQNWRQQLSSKLVATGTYVNENHWTFMLKNGYDFFVTRTR